MAARFRPDGMARALLAMAVLQVVVATVGLVADEHEGTGASAFEVVALNAFFAAVLAGSALLFRPALGEPGRRERRSSALRGH